MSNRIALTLAACLSGCANTQPAAYQEIALVTDQQKASYSNGVDYMQRLRHDDLNVDQNAFLMGVNDVQTNHQLRLSPQEITKADAWQMVEQVKHQNARAAANAEAGKTFLAQNRTQPEVKTLPSGLQYKVLNKGSGNQKPGDNDTIAFNYKLSNTVGGEISSNAKRGKPLVAPITKLIPGSKEAIKRMPKGAKWQLFIPPELAYGENGTQDGKIQPNETVIFEMELVDINPPKALAAMETKPTLQRIYSSAGQ